MPIPGSKIKLTLFWLDGLTSGDSISGDILRPLTDPERLRESYCEKNLFEAVYGGLVFSSHAEKRETMDDVCSDLTNGYCVLIFDAIKKAISFEVKAGELSRSISIPTIEKTVKGAKDAFVETLRRNTALVRRKVKNPELKAEQIIIGRKSSTSVNILYINGIANQDILKTVRERLKSIDIDGLTSAGNIEQYITDSPHSPFPQLIHTERPDKFAADLLAGRIGILADGIPMGFLMPATLSSFIKVDEDRAYNFIVSSALSLIRWLSLLIALLFPAVMVAISMYHQEMLPVKLLESMVTAKQDVPFSVAVEVISMLIAFELLQEAGIRLPDPIGNTVSIIGALIVGQSAVDANVVSPISVIVVATAGICGYTQPSQDLGAALRIIRFFMVILAVLLGMFGIMLGIALLIWHLSSIENFGISYTSPLSDGGLASVAKAFLMPPLKLTKYRDPSLKTEDKRNQK